MRHLGKLKRHARLPGSLVCEYTCGRYVAVGCRLRCVTRLRQKPTWNPDNVPPADDYLGWHCLRYLHCDLYLPGNCPYYALDTAKGAKADCPHHCLRAGLLFDRLLLCLVPTRLRVSCAVRSMDGRFRSHGSLLALHRVCQSGWCDARVLLSQS